MKRERYLVLLLPLLSLPVNLACHVDADDNDDETTLKVDTKGDKKSIEIEKD
jgi:hypothetical protein